MRTTLRAYTSVPGFTEDFFKVRDFLLRIHEPGYKDENWLWARWEYMFSHPALDEQYLSRIGIWEDQGRIVAMANYEDSLGYAFFSFDRAYSFLKQEMLDYALQHLCIQDDQGNKVLKVMINQNDAEFVNLIKTSGFEEGPFDPTSVFMDASTDYTLPEGFSVTSLAEDNDLRKLDRVLWRGFNHEGEPPEDELDGRKKMQSGPNFRHDLNMVVKAPNGDYASYAGMWYEQGTDYVMVEPVATDPTYRKMGLGKAAVLAGIKRCMDLGAKVAYVGSGQQFYYSIGFKPSFNSRWYKKVY